jgi:hypothetical protein
MGCSRSENVSGWPREAHAGSTAVPLPGGGGAGRALLAFGGAVSAVVGAGRGGLDGFETAVVARDEPCGPDPGRLGWLCFSWGLAGAKQRPAVGRAGRFDDSGDPTIVRAEDVPSMQLQSRSRRRWIAANELRPSLQVVHPERVAEQHVVVVADVLIGGDTLNPLCQAGAATPGT